MCVCNHQQNSNWTSQWVRDPGSSQKSHVSTQAMWKQACAALVTLAPASPGGGGSWALCPCGCESPPQGAVGSSTSSMAVEVTLCVSVLCVHICVAGTCAQLPYWLSLQHANITLIPQPGLRPRVPSQGCSSWAEGPDWRKQWYSLHHLTVVSHSSPKTELELFPCLQGVPSD